MRLSKASLALSGLLLAAFGAGAWWLNHRAESGTAPAAGTPAGLPPVRVSVQAVARADVPVTAEGIGTIQGANTVTIRSRIDGAIMEVAFREGQEVKAGDVLFRIDPRPLRAALDQAKGKLAQSQAQLGNARLDLDRYQQSIARGATTRQTLDTQQAMVTQLEAQIQGDKASVEAAQTQLDYATIRSPIDGRTGLRQIDAGNLVSAGGGSALVTVTQLKPISVLFTLPESTLGPVNQAVARGPVEIVLAGRDTGKPLARGTLDLVDNQIDPSTGTIKLKASLPNEDLSLWPGQFVNVKVRLDMLRDRVSVPAAAVQRGPNGEYVYVVKEDRTVESRPVEIASQAEGRAIVAKGLTPGEIVVTDGQYKLKPGMSVVPVDPVARAASQPGSAPQSGDVPAGQRRRAQGPAQAPAAKP